MSVAIVPAGAIVGVRLPGFFHVGIISEHSPAAEQTVVSASARRNGVVEESIGDFSQGRSLKVLGYPSDLPADVVIHRARQRLGKSYDFLTANCDHLVTHAHGEEPNSPQLRKALTFVVAVGIISLAIQLARKR